MSTVTQTPRGWSFIHKGQRYEYPTREQAQEALDDLQHDKTPAPPTDYAETRRAVCCAVDEALAPDTTDAELEILDWIDEQARLTPAYQMGYGEGYSAGRRDLMAGIRKQLGEPEDAAA